MRRLRRRTARALAVLAVLCAWSTGPARAQSPPTNIEVFQAIALECLSAAPDAVGAFLLAAPDQMPYVRTALLHSWQQDGHTIFLPDTSAAARTRLSYEIEEVAVRYERAGRGAARRTVTLALRHRLTAPDGRLLAEDRCRDAATDVVPADALDALESTAFAETRGARPPAGWVRRYLEPTVLTAATAVAVYLFFTLRRDSVDG